MLLYTDTHHVTDSNGIGDLKHTLDGWMRIYIYIYI